MVECSELSEFYVFAGVGVYKNSILWHKKWHVTFITLFQLWPSSSPYILWCQSHA